MQRRSRREFHINPPSLSKRGIRDKFEADRTVQNAQDQDHRVLQNRRCIGNVLSTPKNFVREVRILKDSVYRILNRFKSTNYIPTFVPLSLKMIYEGFFFSQPPMEPLNRQTRMEMRGRRLHISLTVTSTTVDSSWPV
ncbi:hypothetical protein AVEN_173095-1 [Araneus ventricosus]|uniref:Uncharacterized protein n=1 Tax=Araneus ventricosus TaxID=182803 RepID=A0A4Y2HS51_ARAVE|nr:hypothetical protein AVEN_173095-1 [Araneus ventricosus]